MRGIQQAYSFGTGGFLFCLIPCHKMRKEVMAQKKRSTTLCHSQNEVALPDDMLATDAAIPQLK